MRSGPVLFSLLLASCSSRATPIELVTSDSSVEVEEMLRFIPYSGFALKPGGAGRNGIAISVARDLDCDECYRLERSEHGLEVHAGGRLGTQYGTSHALELLGFRFFHPFDTVVPDEPALPPPGHPDLGRTWSPERKLRGLHLHTLHPIEAYDALWEPSPEHERDAARVFDWVIKNRGNYVEWVGLDNIQRSAAELAAWRQHQSRIADYAHQRGLRIGLGIQLFGESNLQQGFDLVDAGEAITAEGLQARLGAVAGVGFDTFNLSFGEFFGADPERLIDAVNATLAAVHAVEPRANLVTTVHVGNSPRQRVSFRGESVPYYFLVKFADPSITPWIHTVMYYNLFESAGGAYQHEDFADHRDFLAQRLRAGQPVGYFPETAYWVAFDISVPIYLPLYVRSRWLDLARIRKELGGDPDQVLFSSGWEWGYWQNDYASLRASYTLPESHGELFSAMFSPFGQAGAELGAIVSELAERQADWLIGKRLAPYFAGRDQYIDFGDSAGVTAQPDRVRVAEVAGLSTEARATLANDVLGPLEAVATELAGFEQRLSAVRAPPTLRPWLSEIRDGVAVTTTRARFVAAAYRAALAQAEGRSPAADLKQADQALHRAEDIVSARHQHLHAGKKAALVNDRFNSTLYQWGYLKQADTLCYWRREKAELQMTLGDAAILPDCVN